VNEVYVLLITVKFVEVLLCEYDNVSIFLKNN